MLSELFAITASTFALATPQQDLAARATALKLPHVDRIVAAALPGAGLGAGGDGAVGRPRLGGDPDLPAGMKWPTCRGKRMSFLGQLPLADLAAVAPGVVPAG